jgi:hypothetical protein
MLMQFLVMQSVMQWVFLLNFVLEKNLLKNPVKEMVFSEKLDNRLVHGLMILQWKYLLLNPFLSKNKFDYSDIMHKWTEWINEGKYTANGETFDVGRTCLSAIRQFSNGIRTC